MKSVEKDPAEILPYGWTWVNWLESGETIVSSVWTVDTGLAVESDSFDDDSTTVWFSGGTENTDYVAINTITTSISPKASRRRIKVRVRLR